MQTTNVHRLTVVLLFTFSMAAVAFGRQSFAQDERTPPPGIVIDKSPDFKQIHVGSPSMEILPDGTYVASHDWFGSAYRTKKVTVVFQSKDQGTTWQKISEFEGQKGSMMFAVGPTLWHMGWCTPGIQGKSANCIAIRRSDDGGKTWTTPTDEKSGLLLSDKHYFVDPAPVLFYKGRIWKEVEVVGPKDKSPRNWATGYRPMVASAPQDADLLDKSNWTFSNSVPWTSRPGLGGWLEGNVLYTPEGKLIIQMRVDDIKHCGKAAQIQVSDDGTTASYDPSAGFASMPGGCKKFVIKFDELSKKYWSLVNWVHPDDVAAPDKERVRNTLALVCSDDLKAWEIRTIVLRHPSTKIGFQYCDWRIDGDDMVFVCRLGWEGAPNCHDANYLTFHRLKNFRTLTRDHDAWPFSVPGQAFGVRPTAAEMQTKQAWFQKHWAGSPRVAELPFAFQYNGRSSAQWLAQWPRRIETTRLDKTRTQHTLIWNDPATGLEVRCVGVDYADFPTVEWTVYLKNVGQQNTPILSDLQGLDTRLEREPQGEFLLRHWKGDTCRPDLYEPLGLTLGPAASQRLAPVGGRGSNGAFPYYNLQMPGGGLMLAVGWPGQWAATFQRDAQRGLRITAGQEVTHLTLQPGEQVRTPLIALVFWHGADTVRAQNLWRRWMWAHNVPRTADGYCPPPLLFGNTSLQFNEMCNANEGNQKQFIDRYLEERIPIDFWWMDAGWYPCGGQWPKTGTWEPDRERFPAGLRAIADHAASRGVQTLVWFEPERVAPGTWLAEHHPEWLLGGKLLNLGSPAARTWLTDHVDRVLAEQAIALYRQDFNMDPLDFWRKNDSPDRLGMTENLHIQGYLAYWDALRRRHPQLILDSCASGGRRNDLETMRRAVPLHPTDYNYADLPAKQAFHSSLFQWIPYFGSNTLPVKEIDAYGIRSGHAPGLILSYDLRSKDLDYAKLRRLVDEWRLVAPCYMGDYYPLAPYSRDENHWIAWQFNRPDQGDGLIEAFRRTNAPGAASVFPLHGLDPAAKYLIRDLESKTSRIVTGKELLEHGLHVEIKSQPGASIVHYKRAE